MAAKKSGCLGKILSTLFTSLVAPFLVGLALQDHHDGEGKPPQGEPRGTLDTPTFSESRYGAVPALASQQVESGGILPPPGSTRAVTLAEVLRYVAGRSVLPLVSTDTWGSGPLFSGGARAAEEWSSSLPLTSPSPEGTRQAETDWNRPPLTIPE